MSKQQVNDYAFYAWIITRLIEARVNAGLSRSQLAQRINADPDLVRQWERGEVVPTMTTIVNLAAVLRIPLDRVFPPLAIWLGVVVSVWLSNGFASMCDDLRRQDRADRKQQQ